MTSWHAGSRLRLHQASQLYGVASTRLGDGRMQTDGPEAALHERATGEELRGYYARVLEERLRASGRVEFFPEHEYDDGTIRPLTTGEEREVRVRRRVVDASYLAPDVPAVNPPPFAVDGGARVVPARLLPTLEVNGTPDRWVVVGSGKTATDTCIWLLDRGVDPAAIAWVRPRDPWMLNRAVILPDPAVFIGMAADLMESAADAVTSDDLMLSTPRGSGPERAGRQDVSDAVARFKQHAPAGVARMSTMVGLAA